ncbi:unnamed protein product [Rangifer tarandus platyrhynchus]|uniref:Uncharacterized protein n=1 Tax=Rangifer tarandus platyrhynchus TaxID=3082113 RepID=A0ABN8ZRE4_RANTA|nr:unnamed protein product [Rangifer tarandus platyrhynchus]
MPEETPLSILKLFHTEGYGFGLKPSEERGCGGAGGRLCRASPPGATPGPLCHLLEDQRLSHLELSRRVLSGPLGRRGHRTLPPKSKEQSKPKGSRPSGQKSSL